MNRSNPERELEAFVDRRDDAEFSLQHSSAFESLIHLYLYRGDISQCMGPPGRDLARIFPVDAACASG